MQMHVLVELCHIVAAESQHTNDCKYVNQYIAIDAYIILMFVYHDTTV